MTSEPQPAPYRPETAILDLGDAFYDAVAPADFPKATMRFRNDRQAAAVGLAGMSDDEWVRHFARFEPLPDNLPKPLALRYHGHQFRVYNPDIGDGRGFLFAQLRDDRGRLLDLGTKGSGQTPYSRFGDGRLTLKGAVRELLATEMLEALGAETSKTFSLIETGEPLERNDEPSPTRSAVLVRLQHSHIRIGTFQRLATLGEADNLRKLTDYCLRHYYPEVRHCEERSDEAIQPSPPIETGLLRSARNDDGSCPAARLLGAVAGATARLAASYIAAGFVHGVLNSDNIAITAQSFDYGPWRWTPYWDGGFTAAYFDHQGLYAFARQPEAIHWDLVQLARSLAAIAEADALEPELDRFPTLFREALRDAIFARLGIVPGALDEDMILIAAIEEALSKQTVTIDRFFFDWRGGRLRDPNPATSSQATSYKTTLSYKTEEFSALAARLAAYEPVPGARDHPYWSDAEPCSMHIEEVEAIWAAIEAADDWSPLHAKIAAIRRMGEALAANA